MKVIKNQCVAARKGRAKGDRQVTREFSLQAEPREATGKGAGRRLRAGGRIPAVVYGLERPCISVSVDAHDLEHLMARVSEHVMISLEVGQNGPTEHVIVRESQRDPITDRLVHADFHRIDPSRLLQIEIPIAPKGVAVGTKEGGLLERLVRTVTVRCLPANMPAVVEIDVSEIRIGHSLHVNEVTPPEGLEILTSPETALFTVLAPRKVEEVVAEVAAEAEEAEPELVAKTKEEEKAEEESGGKA